MASLIFDVLILLGILLTIAILENSPVNGDFTRPLQKLSKNVGMGDVLINRYIDDFFG